MFHHTVTYPSEKQRPTLRTIAEVAGVHVATVSKALNNHPKLAQATRDRIRRIADDLGYRPDPQLAVLNAYRHGRRTHARETLALIHPPRPVHPEECLALKNSGWTRRLCDYADQQGFDIDTFNLGDPETTPSSIDRVLRARGIRGVIVSARTFHPFSLELSWDRYAAVAFGFPLLSPALTSVTDHPYMNTRGAFRRLRSLGYRRIGLVRDLPGEERIQGQCLASYLHECYFASEPQPPPFTFQAFDDAAFREWFDAYRPDAILAGAPHHLEPIKALGFRFPEDCALALLNAPPEDNQYAGIRLQIGEAIRKTVDVVAASLRRREYGVPREKLYYLVEGRWADGASCPERRGNGITAADTAAGRAREVG